MATAATGKKLINSVERCVDDNLHGYVALNPGVRLLKGHRVVVRADFEELEKAGKVAVVCGGGSGHEPAFSGNYQTLAVSVLHIYTCICRSTVAVVYTVTLTLITSTEYYSMSVPPNPQSGPR